MRFTPEAAIGIFRTVQEALTNILKHAGAKTVDLSVQVLDGFLVLQITDDGKGLPPARLRALGSHGLAAMRHRISALGGNWEIHSPPDGGTVVAARIPLAKILLPQPESHTPADGRPAAAVTVAG